MIKTIHRLWIGPNPMPDNYKKFGKKLHTLNPDWTIKDWTQKDIDSEEWENGDLVKSLSNPPKGFTAHPIAVATQTADILRYEILYKYGGMYLDCDIEPVKSLSELFSIYPEIESNPTASHEPTCYLKMLDNGDVYDGLTVNNNFLYAPEPGLEFFRMCIDRLKETFDPFRNMAENTGPGLLSSLYADYRDSLFVVDYRAFNAMPIGNIGLGKDAVFDKKSLSKLTIGMHHYGHRKNQRPNFSWVRENSP